jgi:enoyl reductase
MSRAVIITRTGGTEVLDVVEVEEPHAGPGMVRVAVRTAGLNPFDSKVRRGDFPLPLPRRQGAEFAGVVDEVGPAAAEVGRGVDEQSSDGVTPRAASFAVGDEVLGWIGSGAQSDFVVVAATSLAPKPQGLDWAVAGGLGLVANTAWNAVEAVGIASGDTVLVTGAAGGVGLMAAQFALQKGAAVVGTASRPHHGLLESLGVVPIAYGPGEADRARTAAPGGFTAAVDTVGAVGVDLARALGVPADRIDSVAMGADAESRGIRTAGGGRKSASQLSRFAEDAAAGRLTLPVRATFPLAEVRAAYDLLDTGHGAGKIVLTLP